MINQDFFKKDKGERVVIRRFSLNKILKDEIQAQRK